MCETSDGNGVGRYLTRRPVECQTPIGGQKKSRGSFEPRPPFVRERLKDYMPLLKLSLISSRAMIMRRISEVPAPISHSF